MKFCLNGGLLLGTVDGANIEIAESVGENNVCECYLFIPRRLQELVTNPMSHLCCVVFFGHLTPDVEELRYQHLYHPVPIEQKCPALAHVLNKVSEGTFGDGAPYEPYVIFFLPSLVVSSFASVLSFPSCLD
jgi:glycogen phosphorylase